MSAMPVLPQRGHAVICCSRPETAMSAAKPQAGQNTQGRMDSPSMPRSIASMAISQPWA